MQMSMEGLWSKVLIDMCQSSKYLTHASVHHMSNWLCDSNYVCQCRDQPDHFSLAVISINGIEDEVTSYITWCTVLHECQIAAYRSCVVWALISHSGHFQCLTFSQIKLEQWPNISDHRKSGQTWLLMNSECRISVWNVFLAIGM